MAELSDTLLHYTRARGGLPHPGNEGVQSATRSPLRNNLFQRQDQNNQQRPQSDPAPYQHNPPRTRQFDESLRAFSAPIQTHPGHIPVLSSDALILLQQSSQNTATSLPPARTEQPQPIRLNQNKLGGFQPPPPHQTAGRDAETTSGDKRTRIVTLEKSQETYRLQAQFLPAQKDGSDSESGSSAATAATFPQETDPAILTVRSRHAAQAYANGLMGYPIPTAQAENVMVA